MLLSPRENETRFGRIGLTVSRRVGGSVVRNRVQRRLREWYRMSCLSRVEALDVVVIARSAAAEIGSAELSADLDSLARQGLAKVAS